MLAWESDLPVKYNRSMDDSGTRESRRRWLRFSLRTLLVFVLVLSVPLAWLAVTLERVRKERRAVRRIEQLGGTAILRDGNVVEVHLFYEFSYDHESAANADATDDDLRVLCSLPNLERLYICDGPFTDGGLQELHGLSSLSELSITSSQHGFYRQDLELGPRLPGVSSAGLVHLRHLPNLKRLILNYANVDDAGLLYLLSLQNLEELHLDGARITDAGLEHLKGLTRLEGLWLRQTRVTDEGVAKLQDALPTCRIEH